MLNGVIIDEPAGRRITGAVCKIRGWCSARSRDDLLGLHFDIEGMPVTHNIVRRPDAEGARPGMAVIGFAISFDLSHYIWAIREKQFVMCAATWTGRPLEVQFEVSAGAITGCLAAAAGA